MDKYQLEWLLKIHRRKITDDEYDALLLVLGEVPLSRISKRFGVKPMKMKAFIQNAIAKLY